MHLDSFLPFSKQLVHDTNIGSFYGKCDQWKNVELDQHVSNCPFCPFHLCPCNYLNDEPNRFFASGSSTLHQVVIICMCVLS